jgi:hypothetical protein
MTVITDNLGIILFLWIVVGSSVGIAFVTAR